MFHNFRIVSFGPGGFAVDSQWTVRDSELGVKLPYMLRTIAEYREAEPSMNWKLQTRGEVRDWHDYEQV